MKRFQLRLDDDLHAELERSARANSRSLHGECVARLGRPALPGAGEDAAPARARGASGKVFRGPDPKVKGRG